ncbi:MAG: radical SAM protein [Gammaproteobacteria bacterium]|nr:radical SAM protein [Gammaproteobacteria bacterium]MCH9743683.1 radical SAM protein [Gammaproteobacteria bacterium]
MKLDSIFTIVLVNIKIWIYKLFCLQHLLVPYKVLINLTNVCNSRCVYCDIWKINREQPELRRQEITNDDIGKLFKDMGKHLKWIAFSGGEITVIRNFTEVLDYAKQYCKKLKIITFTTNALRPKTAIKYAEYAKKLGFDIFVTISLDGDQKKHDELRGVKGNYVKCEALFKELKERNINVHYGITVGEDNHDFIMDEYQGRKDEIRAITFVHDHGIYKKDNEMNYGPVIKALRHIYRHYGLHHLSDIIELIHVKISALFLEQGFKKDIIPCEVINTSIHVMPYGEVKPCMFMPDIGNIKQESLLDILKNKKTMDARKKIKAGKCPHCWMNCYSPHSIMQHPIKSLTKLLKG